MTENPYEDSLTPIEGSEPAAQTRGCAGWIVGVAAVVLVAALFLPGVFRGGAREAARRTQCKNNLKQIASGLHNYHDVHGHFPPAFTVDDNGNRLHSWRTLILPYLEEGYIYKSIDLSKPWNHPDNAVARNSDTNLFSCLSTDMEKGFTNYLGLVGPNGFFPVDGTTRRLRDITDGTSNTLVVTEVPPSAAIHWMNPADDEAIGLLLGLSEDSETPHIDGVQAALADGSVRFFHYTTRRDVLEAMITPDADDVIPEDF